MELIVKAVESMAQGAKKVDVTIFEEVQFVSLESILFLVFAWNPVQIRCK